jgi:hypothetical protein
VFSGLYEIFPRVEKSRRHSIFLLCCRGCGRRNVQSTFRIGCGRHIWMFFASTAGRVDYSMFYAGILLDRSPLRYAGLNSLEIHKSACSCSEQRNASTSTLDGINTTSSQISRLISRSRRYIPMAGACDDVQGQRSDGEFLSDLQKSRQYLQVTSTTDTWCRKQARPHGRPLASSTNFGFSARARRCFAVISGVVSEGNTFLFM